jgi:hypothetical protein
VHWIPGVLTLLAILTAASIVLNAPLLVLLIIARRRMNPVTTRVLVATGFAAATAYFIWRMEWFDVYRHGVPSVAYMLMSIVPYTVVLGLTGWLLGMCITPRQRV